MIKKISTDPELQAAFEQLCATVARAEQDPFWQEQFRLIDQYKQGIRDLHGREPTDEEMTWYMDTQNPFKDGDDGTQDQA